MPACSCDREIKVGESSGEAALVVAVVKKIRGGRERRELLLLHNLVEKNQSTWRQRQIWTGRDRAACCCFFVAFAHRRRECERELLYERDVWEREWEWELLLLLPPAVRERAICEREESVKCVHTCMCAVLPATGERVKSKYWYCVPPVCLLGLLACETDRGGCWLIWSMEEQWMRWWCFASIFLSTDTEGKGEKDLRNKERKRQ